MTRILSTAAFIFGAAIVIWMGSGFVGSNPLALMVTGLIGIVYGIGFVELMRFQRDTQALVQAIEPINGPIDSLSNWLSKVPEALRSTVQMRVQGERIPLPAPMLTPYLVGLLVMLGLLGTFVGMVDTLKGAVFALEGTTELEAIRAGLAAPIKGLGLAFSTSVAGVSASAILGFISTLSRRQRALASQALDSHSYAFVSFCANHQRDQAYQVMQAQADVMPAVAQTLTGLSDKLATMAETINQQLVANQNQLYREVSESYQTLSQSVDASLHLTVERSRQALDDSLQKAVQGIEPLMADMVHSIGKQVSDTQQQQLTEFNEASGQWLNQQQVQSQQQLKQWQDALTDFTDGVQVQTQEQHQAQQVQAQQHLQSINTLLAASEQLVEQRIANEQAWLSQCDQRIEELVTQLTAQLSQLRADEAKHSEAVVASLQKLNRDAATHLERLGTGLEAPMARLIETASKTPQAAAEVISQLRTEISHNLERDNQLLQERQQLAVQLSQATDALAQSGQQQQAALEGLSHTSAETLTAISQQFDQHIEQGASRLHSAVDDISVSAVELASLGDAFGAAVEQFGQSSRDVSDMLTLIEENLSNNAKRSDEQMAYYIAQAREIIDHSVLSQQEAIEQLRQVTRTQIAEA